jgi:hypothetical protein
LPYRCSSGFDCSHPVRTRQEKSSMRSSILLNKFQWGFVATNTTA